jgi:hypothetical protein
VGRANDKSTAHGRRQARGLRAERERQVKLEESPRPIRRHYAGATCEWACASVENAAENAFHHVLRGHCSNAQVVRPNNDDAFRVQWTSVGILCWCPPEVYHRPTLGRVKTKLHRIK